MKRVKPYKIFSAGHHRGWCGVHAIAGKNAMPTASMSDAVENVVVDTVNVEEISVNE